MALYSSGLLGTFNTYQQKSLAQMYHEQILTNQNLLEQAGLRQIPQRTPEPVPSEKLFIEKLRFEIDTWLGPVRA